MNDAMERAKRAETLLVDYRCLLSMAIEVLLSAGVSVEDAFHFPCEHTDAAAVDFIYETEETRTGDWPTARRAMARAYAKSGFDGWDDLPIPPDQRELLERFRAFGEGRGDLP